MKKTTLAFVALCLAAPGTQLLERYGHSHWDNAVDYPVLVLGFVLLLALFLWSIIGIGRHLVRGVAGVLICAYCVWQAWQNGSLTL